MRNPRYIPFATPLAGATAETIEAVKDLNQDYYMVDPTTIGYEHRRAPASAAEAVTLGKEKIRNWMSSFSKVNAKVDVSKTTVIALQVESSLNYFVINGERKANVTANDLR